jgi:hypothetical protein
MYFKNLEKWGWKWINSLKIDSEESWRIATGFLTFNYQAVYPWHPQMEWSRDLTSLHNPPAWISTIPHASLLFIKLVIKELPVAWLGLGGWPRGWWRKPTTGGRGEWVVGRWVLSVPEDNLDPDSRVSSEGLFLLSSALGFRGPSRMQGEPGHRPALRAQSVCVVWEAQWLLSKWRFILTSTHSIAGDMTQQEKRRGWTATCGIWPVCLKCLGDLPWKAMWDGNFPEHNGRD